MDNIRATANLVKKMLQDYPITRLNDEYLYFEICSDILKRQDRDIKGFTLENALLHRKMYDLPKFETVRRARQKIQASCPELASTDYVSNLRAQREQDYRAYALEVEV